MCALVEGSLLTSVEAVFLDLSENSDCWRAGLLWMSCSMRCGEAWGDSTSGATLVGDLEGLTNEAHLKE